MPLLDRLGRPLETLRVSITDRCNFRCVYCMPKEVFGRDYAFLDRRELLSFEELTRVVRVFASLGVRTVRLTGGEPLVRRDVEGLVAQLAAIPRLELALTTNGAPLPHKAQALADAGLTPRTVRLDSGRAARRKAACTRASRRCAAMTCGRPSAPAPPTWSSPRPSAASGRSAPTATPSSERRKRRLCPKSRCLTSAAEPAYACPRVAGRN